jgi:beta-glucanase (GH16 family)
LIPAALLVLAACGGGSGAIAPPGPAAAATPSISASPAQNGAVVVSLASTTSGAAIYYTVDGSAPGTTSPIYLAPVLVASNVTVKAMATASGLANSAVASQNFAPNIPAGTLVWSDEFANATGANAQPNPNVWTYDTGTSGFGNQEWEDYCAWGSTAAPCNPSQPNTYVGTDGYLHIIARQAVAGAPAAGNYTSARLKTQGLFSLQYGRFEARIKLPEAQGLWPAAWLLGNNIATVNWPACGEQDVEERVNAAGAPDWNAGSIHAPGLNATTNYNFPAAQTAAGWHTYGMIWSKGSVAYYVDDPSRPYATYTASSYASTPGATWTFDGGQANFIILNLAVGGSWPGPPTAATPFPAEMLVDYVRVYTN